LTALVIYILIFKYKDVLVSFDVSEITSNSNFVHYKVVILAKSLCENAQIILEHAVLELFHYHPPEFNQNRVPFIVEFLHESILVDIVLKLNFLFLDEIHQLHLGVVIFLFSDFRVGALPEFNYQKSVMLIFLRQMFFGVNFIFEKKYSDISHFIVPLTNE